MAGKFMKVKRFVMSAITCVLIVSQLVGCAAMASTEMMDLLDAGGEVEITMAVPSYQSEIQVQQQEYMWEQLDQLKTYNVEFREPMDKLFNINKITINGVNGKSGCMYINQAGERDGNTVFVDSLRNKPFMEKYMKDTKVTSELSELASKIYIDIEKGDRDAVYAGLNAYFNLFNEEKDVGAYFNGSQSLTREDFYSFVYRINHGVGELTIDNEFNIQVGGAGGSNIFASQVDEYAWLNVANDALKPGNYKSAITKAEAIYMLMNYYFGEDLANINVKNISLSDARNGGDMLNAGREKLQVKDKETNSIHTANAWQLGVLSKMQDGTKGTVHVDFYKALGLANNLGLIGKTTNWNGPMTKSEAIDLVVKINQVLNNRDGYITTAEYGTQPDNIIDNEAFDGIVDGSDSEIIDNEGLTDDNNIVEEQPVENVKPDTVKPTPKPPAPKPEPEKPAPKPPAPKPEPEKPAPEQGSGTDVNSGTATGEHGARPGTEDNYVPSTPENKDGGDPDGAW